MPIYLIQVTGRDDPGLLEQLTLNLAARDARVLDIGQAVIHNTLNLGILVELAGDASEALTDVRSLGRGLNLELSVSSVLPADYESWVVRQGEGRHIITLFGPCLRARHLARISGIVARAGLNIWVVNRLSGRISLDVPCSASNSCVELSVRGTPVDPVALRREVLAAAQELNCDIAIQRDDVFRRHRRMIAFDMDSTLIEAEMIDEMARRHGVMDQVARITAAAMNGEIDFDQALRRRLGLLKGLSQDVLEDIARKLPITPGAERLVRTVRALGYKTAILSGGFTYFGLRLQQQLEIDTLHANELEIVDGVLTGNVVGPIVNGRRKAELLGQIAEREGIRMEQVIAVGDGANDLPMLSLAGLGIAFRAKPKVRESAEQHIGASGLDGILYLLGVRDRDVPE